ncbi:MAG: hypothetical protein RMM53_11015, partial [Bacteroidia bacterium]|nr:hypothetical protein [Bacteroidia bacterium]
MWQIVQNAQGMLFMANDAGVVVFDGSRWEVVETQTAARALALDKDGKIYVGGKSDVGCLDVNAKGEFEYRSFRKYLPEKARALSDVERVYCLGDWVYYVAENFVLTAKDDGNLATISITPIERYAGSGSDGEKLYINLEGKGLHVFSGGKLVPVAGGEVLASSYIRFMAKTAEGKTYVGTENEGLFVGAAGGKFSPLGGAAGETLRNEGIFCGAAGRDGSLLLGTYSGGAVHISSSGGVLGVYSKKTGYASNEIYSVFIDSEDGLWIAHAVGLTLVHPSLPVAFYPDFAGKITSVVEDGDKLYVGTLSGLFVGGVFGGTFVGTALKAEVLTMKKIGGRLVAATNMGLLDVTGGGSTFLMENTLCTSIFASGRNEAQFYACHAGGVNRFEVRGGGINNLGPIEGVNFEVTSIVEDGEDLWLGTAAHGLALVRGGKVVRFGSREGLSDGEVRVRKIGAKPVFQTKSGLFDYLPGDNKFVLNERYTKVFGPLPNDFYAESETRFWLFKPTGLVLATLQGENFQFDEALPVNVFNKKTEAFALSEERIWVAHQSELVRYDRKRAYSPRTDIYALVRNITVGRDSVYFAGAWPGKRNAPVYLPPE